MPKKVNNKLYYLNIIKNKNNYFLFKKTLIFIKIIRLHDLQGKNITF
jgi:hypothetical protein